MESTGPHRCRAVNRLAALWYVDLRTRRLFARATGMPRANFRLDESKMLSERKNFE